MAAMSVLLARHRFTVDEYHAMARAGVLTEDDRVELVEGEIVDMTPIGLRHQAAVDALNQRLARQCGDRAIVRIQGSVRLDVHSEPQPDALLLRPRDDFYRATPATAADVLLLVEVADTSLVYDRTVKVPLYARAGIPEVWLVDLVGERVEVFREPGPEGYRHRGTEERGVSLAPAAFPDVAVPVELLLG
jgi:Uma2 family endonuclease